VLEFVVPGEWETDTLDASDITALTNELPSRRVTRVDLGRELADAAIHLSQQLAHDMLQKSRLR
jgi:hypothetical protein